MDRVRDEDGELPPIFATNRNARRKRSEWFEKALKTIGTFTEASVITVHTSDPSAKSAAYRRLLVLLQELLEAERGRAVVWVDGTDDGGGHILSAHRDLEIQKRLIVEDAVRRASAESQLLQMADACVHAAFQSLARKKEYDPRFWAAYVTSLESLIHRPSAWTKAGAFGI